MEKTKLSVKTIYEKEFKIDFKGYVAADVDAFLDAVLEDYQIFSENIEELSAKIVKLENELTNEKNKNRELEGASTAFKSNDYNSLDLLKRVSRLEEAVFNKNK